ncbi:dual specificity tyrosine-phosphorylation-regulated kinase 4-like [Callorhinchus milii]|uniref:dual specificity tyrosine-phosphorylation-regulated kinase 4-like n=1 Tax=Callorhinchus milii TaxID=7868 RepID=UPI001C3FBD5E|nr:dual specificity tyrosine-phosphorylation-regulated kinase 4-like [Callorhinchus milii]
MPPRLFVILAFVSCSARRDPDCARDAVSSVHPALQVAAMEFRHEHLRYRYEVLKKIGEGGQGQVIQCLDHKRNILVAIKILVSPSSSKQETYQKMELQIALELQDEGSDEDFNVIKVLNIFHFRGHYCIVMELLKESLHEVIRNAGLRRLDMAMVKTYTRGILKFLRHINSRKIVHADIKPENVLVKDTVTGTVRITDFGTSFFVESQPMNVGGTLEYLAPELLLGYSLTCGVDMWALGCTVAELATGRELFRSNSHEDHLPRCIEILGMPPRYMVNGAPDRTQFFDHRGKMFCPGKKRVPRSFPLHRVLKSDDPEFVEFISSCLRWDPNCRMTPVQARHMGQPQMTDHPMAAVPFERRGDLQLCPNRWVMFAAIHEKEG